MAECKDCGAQVDTTHYIVTPSEYYCQVCEDVRHCENSFPYNGECICGEHTICGAERDVGINESYLELNR